MPPDSRLSKLRLLLSKKLIIIDGHAIIHRAFHAIQPLTTANGELVNAVFGFTSMLMNVFEIERPEYIAVTFDKKGPTFRHTADSTYKATRAAPPDGLIAQIERVYEIVQAFNIPIFAESGFEADDMIATIVKKMEADMAVSIVIVSGDRDLLQLVTEKTSVHDLTGGYRKSINFTPAAVIEKFGFAPQYIPDYKGLAGDTSDNLLGIPGIGPKTASDLIVRFGSLESIYEHLAELSENLRAKLADGREAAFHCRQMATLCETAPALFDVGACRLHDFDRAKVLHLFQELGFRSLIARFEKLFPIGGVVQKAETMQQSLF